MPSGRLTGTGRARIAQYEPERVVVETDADAPSLLVLSDVHYPGWKASVDGHDVDTLLETFRALPFEPGRPSCVIANTTKGRGVSFIEDRVEWHHKVPDAEQTARALEELS